MSGAAVRCRAAAVALAVALTVCACDSSAGNGPGTSTNVGTRTGQLAPSLAGTSLQGPRVSLAAWHGSVVVLVFWASWCVPCQAEQPALDTLAVQEMRKGVRFAGISVDVDAGAARRYALHYALPYDSLVDTAQTIAVDFDIAGPPTTYVIDRRGRVYTELVGALDIDHLGAVITAAAA